MRTLLAAGLAVILAASGPADAIAQSQPNAQQPSVLTPDNSQDNSAIAVPPAPLIVAAPPVPAAPQVPATPPPSFLVPLNPLASDSGNTGNADNGGQDSGSPVAGGPAAGTAPQDQNLAQDTIPTPPNTWQPGKFAQIGVLDKIDGEVVQVSVPVGGQSVVGDLQVSVLACVTRPPDQVPDAAVFLALQSTENLSAPPDYRGWLVRSQPGAAVAGDASETFRIIDCS